MRAMIWAICLFCIPALAADRATATAHSSTSGPQLLPWETLAHVDIKSVDGRYIPAFSNEVIALNDHQVTIQGFMMPLEPGPLQKHFLISVNSSTCPYCLPAGPEGVIEVQSTAPIKYGFEPIVIRGKLAVLKNDPAGVFYRMTKAVLSPAN